MLEGLLFLLASLLILLINYFISKNVFFPPTLYSLIWSTVMFSYVAFLAINTESNFIVDIKTLLVFLCGQILFSISGIVVFVNTKIPEHVLIKGDYKFKYPIDTWLTLFLLLMFPFYLKEIIKIAESSRYANINLYLALRHEYVNNGINLGVLDYLNTISVFTFALYQYKHNFFEKRIGKKYYQIAIKYLLYLITFSYAFLSTGRTYFLLLLSIYFAIKVLSRNMKKYYFVIGAIIFFMLFIVNAFILNKGADVNDSFEDNILSLVENLSIYFLGGVYGFNHVIKSNITFDYGENVFRFFIALAKAFGIVNSKPKELVMPFITNPIDSNVYTIYYNYFKDFGYFGLLFNLIWGYLHTIFYFKAKLRGNFINVYIYALLVYPLVMSFFQDQYMSLLSTWIQLI
ncbi:MAG: O-antigen polymerase, partial [Chitinophagaceae bacterium]